MLSLQPVNPEEIEQIRAEYAVKIAASPAMKSLFLMEQEREVAKAIARQRQEAIDAGGALGARIQAENDALLLEQCMAEQEGERVCFSGKTRLLPSGREISLEGVLFCSAENGADAEPVLASLCRDIFASGLETKGLDGEKEYEEGFLVLPALCSAGKAANITNAAQRSAAKLKAALQACMSIALIPRLNGSGVQIKGVNFTKIGFPKAKLQWVCTCGRANTTAFCPECGSKKDMSCWVCTCGRKNTTKFCPECGTNRDGE